MGLRITGEQVNAIGSHGAREYPNECCGAMLGVETGGVKEVRELAALKNIRQDFARGQELIPLTALETESERNRFLIDPKDLVQVEKQARNRGLDIIGFYHSHPDHPARPSAYDRDHAFPWYSYVIITVEAGKPGPYASWVLREDRSQFDEEEIRIAGQKAPVRVLAGIEEHTGET
ncbi:MAG TPA: M67 family metallopeptidase [Terriglobia bacterium]|nr:M67 family metallopeptidase [Terriglobia bacterium]